MSNHIDGRVIIITGAAGGFGRLVAQELNFFQMRHFPSPPGRARSMEICERRALSSPNGSSAAFRDRFKGGPNRGRERAEERSSLYSK